METIKINGKEYQLDIDKSKELGLLKEKDKKPRSWKEYVEMTSEIVGYKGTYYSDKYDIFKIADEAKAFCSLGKLIQLRDSWWGDWIPDWKSGKYDIYVIFYCGDYDKVIINRIDYLDSLNNRILAFPTEEMATDFFNTFRDLIEKAKMFL